METKTATLCCCLLLLITFIISSLLRTSKKSPLPPGGPLALPIIGHLHLLRHPLHHALAAISSRHGHLLLLRFGLRPVLVLSDPSAVEECLTKNDVTFANRPFLLAGYYFGRRYTGLASAPYGPHWRNQRKVAALHIFSAARIAALSSASSAKVVSLVQYLFTNVVDGQRYTMVNMKEILFELTFKTVVGMMGGKEAVGTEEGRRFRGVIEEAFLLSGASNLEDYVPFVRWVGIKGNVRRMEMVAAKLDTMLQGMVERRRRCKGVEEKTIIDVMLSLQKVEPEHYTDDVIKGIIQQLQ